MSEVVEEIVKEEAEKRNKEIRERDRRIIKNLYDDGKSIEQIAKMLEYTVQEVQALLDGD